MKKGSLTRWVLFVAIFFILPMRQSVCAETKESGAGDNFAICKVVLYKHGVGYFQRRGFVEGGQSVDLYFKRSQMNDLLKSLTVINLSDGQISSIVYDSTKTMEQLLGDYTFDLRYRQGLPAVLGQLQGSKIELKLGSETIICTIMGVERRQVTDEQNMKFPVFLLNVIDGDGRMRNIDTTEISTVKFLDERLERDITKYMEILFAQHRKDEKTLTIRVGGSGPQELLVSYVTEVPVWKATYRIVLDDDEDKKPFLQGWAIVDNVSEKDWENVELTLVSGLPISFVLNLYDPIFKKRPTIEIEEEMAMAPTVPEPGMRAYMAGARDMPKRKLRALDMEKKEANADMEMLQLAAAPPVDLAKRMRQLQAQTVTREVGDLFEYKIDHPVTIQRNRSALLPIVAAEIEGQAVDLYNERSRAKNPLAAVRLKNSTGLTLEGGPLTVMQGNNYAGEALIKTVKPNEQRYVTYAVDLGLHVNTKHGSKSERVDRVIINRGTMRMHRGVVETKTYNLDNKNDRDKTVIIEHPYHKDWKLLNKEKPIEITDNFKRFEVKAPAGELTKFVVREMRDSWERLIVTNLTSDDIIVYAQKKYFSKESQKKLEEIIAIKAEIVRINRQIKTLENDRNEIFNDQRRLRDNLSRLRQTTEEKNLRSRYIRKLTQQESRLEEIIEKQKQLQKQRQIKQQQLDKLIETLEQDIKI